MVVRAIEDNFAAYASASTVLTVIKQLRNRGLPDPMSAAALEAIGVPSSMTAFVLKALLFLGLIDEGGNLTPECVQLRQASTDEYPNTLGQIVKKAYIRVFEIVDPATADETRVADAFRMFEPAKQRDKMVRLFMGLCEEAGIVPESGKRRAVAAPRPRRPTANERPAAVGEEPPSTATPRVQTGLHPALVGLVSDLPAKGASWTKGERDRWLAAFTSNLDYAYPAKAEETP